MAPSCGSWSLWLKAMRVVRRWSRVPFWVFDVPQHLRAYAGRYSDPEKWPTLYGLQHDEKDMFRVVGRAGLQDWGDGDAQARLAALDAATGALAAAVAALRSLPPWRDPGPGFVPRSPASAAAAAGNPAGICDSGSVVGCSSRREGRHAPIKAGQAHGRRGQAD